MTGAASKAPEILTLGCRLNAYESEVMRGLASAAGHEGVIVNTCAVTNEAARQARQAVRRLAREKPGTPIIVTGCAAELEPARFAALPGVARVIPNRDKLSAAAWGASTMAVNDAGSVAETAHHLLDGFGARTRAYVEVQNGCDHRCTFCIIPYARGASRSVPAGAVVAQIRHLVERGTKEVVLTGVDMTAWGSDLPGAPRLGRLVRQILALVPDLKRLRLSSLDPVEIDGELMAIIESEPRLMPHLHLSIQAGDDMILKRMKRRHARADIIALTRRLRAARAEIVFGADLIAGFPTETDAMFERSRALIAECDLTYTHVFPYSARTGTPAARMPQLDRALVKARAERLRAEGAAALGRYLAAQAGARVELLMEKNDLGRTPGFAPARLAARAEPGALVTARVTGHTDDCLLAEAA